MALNPTMKTTSRRWLAALLLLPLMGKRARAQSAPYLGARAVAEVPTGAIDGTNAAFTLSAMPIGNTQLLFRNGLALFPAGGDYTIGGTQVTFDAGSIPQAGDKLVACYWTVI